MSKEVVKKNNVMVTLGLEVDFALSDYQTLPMILEAGQQPDQSWQLQGGMRGDASIPLAALVEGLAQQFKIEAELPEALEEVTLRKFGLVYNITNTQMTFQGGAYVPLDDDDGLEIMLQIEVSSKGFHFSGQMQLGAYEFGLAFANQGFVAHYQNTEGKAIELGPIVERLVPSLADAAADLQIPLKAAILAFIKGGKTSATDQRSNSPAKPATDGGSKFLLGLELGQGLTLSNLPLIGEQLPKDLNLGLGDLGVFLASRDMTSGDMETIKGLMPQENAIPLSESVLPAPGSDEAGGTGTEAEGEASTIVIPRGLTLNGKMLMGEVSQPLSLVLGGKRRAPEPASTSNTPTVPATRAPAQPDPAPADEDDSGIKWMDLNKTLGPVRLERVGLLFADGRLGVLLDGGLEVRGLTLTVEGLGVSCPLSSFDLEFYLKGLSIEYKTPAVQIGGALLRFTDPNGPDRYEGGMIISTKAFSISALGAYTTVDGEPSLFVYALLDKTLGGPPAFMVEGLAAGFGYNRKLKSMSIEEVGDFPLVRQSLAPPAQRRSLTETLKELRPFIPPMNDELFFAIGIKFTSFKLVNGFLLLIAKFGQSFELELLGLAKAVFPPPAAGKAYLRWPNWSWLCKLDLSRMRAFWDCARS